MRPSALRAPASLLGAVLLAIAPPALSDRAPAEVRILSPRGGQTKERVVSIRGSTFRVAGERLTLVLNGVPLSIPRQGDAFETTQVLSPGLNVIRVVGPADGARGAPKFVEDEVALFASVPPKDLRVTLTWDTPTDVDLWVTGPDGEKVFYQHRNGAQGGTLDIDVTTGYGPETYTQARAARGTYRVQAHYYGGVPPTRVVVTVVREEGTPREERQVFRGVLLKQGEVLEAGEFHVGR
jgi:uncharacterized protein YfaP (DUF2135 family)